MKVRVLAFAQAREALGSARIEIELPEGSRVSDALAEIERRAGTIAPLRPHLAVAVDETLANSDQLLTDGCEIALLPPVSGG
jgi:molybdopterin converting factor subunit 1